MISQASPMASAPLEQAEVAQKFTPLAPNIMETCPEAAITPIGIAGFNAAGALSKRNEEPQKASRPFDTERDGFVMGEGAAVMVLESLTYALRRGAHILAELGGYGATSDAHHITQPDASGEGGAKAIQGALNKAGIHPAEIDYIND